MTTHRDKRGELFTWERQRLGSTIEHSPQCKPEDMSLPDHEGIRDCHRCGLWETEREWKVS